MCRTVSNPNCQTASLPLCFPPLPLRLRSPQVAPSSTQRRSGLPQRRRVSVTPCGIATDDNSNDIHLASTGSSAIETPASPIEAQFRRADREAGQGSQTTNTVLALWFPVNTGTQDIDSLHSACRLPLFLQVTVTGSLVESAYTKGEAGQVEQLAGGQAEANQLPAKPHSFSGPIATSLPPAATEDQQHRTETGAGWQTSPRSIAPLAV